MGPWPYMCETSAFFAKIFFQMSVVILNSTLHYQIFKFDIHIQILVWIFGSTYRKGEILKQKWHVNSNVMGNDLNTLLQWEQERPVL